LVKLKLEMVKMISTCRTVNAILMNTKINTPKLVNMRGHKLATCGQNFTNILSLNKNIAKTFRGYSPYTRWAKKWTIFKVYDSCI